MASYHVSVKTTSRSDGSSIVASAAYRAGVVLVDDETGVTFDYRRKLGVISAEIFLPPGALGAMLDRSVLWNSAAAADTRKNSTIGRELEIALPAELTDGQRKKLVRKLCKQLVAKHGFAVDACIHKPHRKSVVSDDGVVDDSINYHVHILITTRQLNADGFGKKTREWDDRKLGVETVNFWRERVAMLTNEALAEVGFDARVDHRSLADQGIDREPTAKLPRDIYIRVKRGEDSYVAEEIQERVAAKHAGRVIAHETAEIAAIDRDIARWTSELKALTVEQSKQAQRQADEAISAAERVVKSLAQETPQTEKYQAVSVANPVAVEEVVTVVKDVLRSERELETLKKKRIAESQQLHATVLELGKKRLQARTADEIAIAKSDLIKINNDQARNADAIYALDKQLLSMNSRFNGLADKLPDFLVPGRADLMKKLAEKREFAIKINARINKSESIAKADDATVIDQSLFHAKKRQAQIFAEVADIDADLSILNRQPKVQQPQQSKVVRVDKENVLNL